MAIENVVFHIPKEFYDEIKKDLNYIDSNLLHELGDKLVKNLIAEGEIVVKLSELCKEEFTPTNSIQLKRQIAWKPLVRCGECKRMRKYALRSDEPTGIWCHRWSVPRLVTDDDFCSYGEKRTDYTVFTVNPPKGVETPLKGDATAFHKNSKITQVKGE